MKLILATLLLSSSMTYSRVEIHNHIRNSSFPSLNKCYSIEKEGTIQLSRKKGQIIIDGKRKKGQISPIFKGHRIIGYKITRFGVEKMYYF